MIDTTMSDGSPTDLPPDPAELELMEALTRELGAAPAPIEIPAAQDDALRAAAIGRAREIRRQRRGSRRPWVALGAAVACAAALLVWINLGGLGGSESERVARAQMLGDVNADGAVDVIDCMVLARALEGGASPAVRFDVTGDGAVDQADADWLADRVVSIERGIE